MRSLFAWLFSMDIILFIACCEPTGFFWKNSGLHVFLPNHIPAIYEKSNIGIFRILSKKNVGGGFAIPHHRNKSVVKSSVFDASEI